MPLPKPSSWRSSPPARSTAPSHRRHVGLTATMRQACRCRSPNFMTRWIAISANVATTTIGDLRDVRHPDAHPRNARLRPTSRRPSAFRAGALALDADGVAVRRPHRRAGGVACWRSSPCSWRGSRCGFPARPIGLGLSCAVLTSNASVSQELRQPVHRFVHRHDRHRRGLSPVTRASPLALLHELFDGTSFIPAIIGLFPLSDPA
ncbi:hypothetical protein DSL92_07955 [Billgrantia gudaonensis]|uniref:Uncharacterized protein n=1 Tax=Billgrantia gudaonensis TaxID=376427 RepID=A0A3S0VSF5_9GAMM|nr:hypothetical protein DSL92_07955 [Halomonas gudaonensis]